jgi:hypothetical protein
MPHNITKQDVVWLLDELREEEYAIQTRKGYIQALRKISMHHNNPAVHKMKIRWPHDMRPNVDWLTYEQAKALLGCAMTPNQELIIAAELLHGLRRCEVARLSVDSFKGFTSTFSVKVRWAVSLGLFHTIQGWPTSSNVTPITGMRCKGTLPGVNGRTGHVPDMGACRAVA